jgi:hypothetical protein
MTFEEASEVCHVRSAIYRMTDPDKKYWKNNPKLLKDQVPPKDQLAHDWLEYDPREGESIPINRH